MDFDSDDSCVTEEEVLRWNASAAGLPLPPHYVPRGGAPLENLSDETLLTAPPHLLVHVQRTASQGGLQVVSPRQIPFTYMMLRGKAGERQIGDHVVGSIADPYDEWPTIDDASFDHLLPDEPIMPQGQDTVVRKKTKTVPLTSAGRFLTDPILGCLVRGRAVIDVLRRDDVMGGADELVELLAAAWGIDRKDLDDLDAFSLGISGPLLRHAIKVDDVYPTTYAPIHMRRSVSVGASDVNRNYIPEDTAMDWRRMRVYCEAVFLLAMMTEGIPMRKIKANPPPGDPSARTDRPHVLVFQPAPCTAWTHESHTFAVAPLPKSMVIRPSAIPRDVLMALSKYTDVVKPMTMLANMGYVPSAKQAHMEEAITPVGETLTNQYSLMLKTIMVGAARGRTAAAAVRSAIYEGIEGAPLDLRMAVVRYIMITKEECLAHLDEKIVPDEAITKLAKKLLDLGVTIRVKVVAEAARRGKTVEEWWGDILAQAPARFETFVEGSMGWTTIALWMLFRGPTDRWKKLISATNFSVLRSAAKCAVGAARLPALKGSMPRLIEAARGATRNITRAYAGYYKGVADVGLVIADIAEARKRMVTAKTLREAAYLWILRARAYRGINVSGWGKDMKGNAPKDKHYVIPAKPVNLILKPAPYRAFEAYRAHVADSEVLPRAYKLHIQNYQAEVVSTCFTSWTQPLGHVRETTLTRYILAPKKLGEDMEVAWQMLRSDLIDVAATYGSSERSRSPSPSGKRQRIEIMHVTAQMPHVEVVEGEEQDYFQLLAEMDEDQVDWLEERLEEAGAVFEEEVTTRKWVSPGELLAYVRGAVAEIESSTLQNVETVR